MAQALLYGKWESPPLPQAQPLAEVCKPHGSATERMRATHLLPASDSDDERAHQGDSDLGSDSLFPPHVPQPHPVPAAADANAEPALPLALPAPMLDQAGPQPGMEPAVQQPQTEPAGVQEAAPGTPVALPGQQQQQALARTSTRLEHRSSGPPLGQIREGETLQETASQQLLGAGGSTEAAKAGPSTSGALTTGSCTLSGASAGSPLSLSSRGGSLEAGLERGGEVWHDSAGSAPPDRMSRDGFEQYIKSRWAGHGRACWSPCCLSRPGQWQVNARCQEWDAPPWCLWPSLECISGSQLCCL